MEKKIGQKKGCDSLSVVVFIEIRGYEAGQREGRFDALRRSRALLHMICIYSIATGSELSLWEVNKSIDWCVLISSLRPFYALSASSATLRFLDSIFARVSFFLARFRPIGPRNSSISSTFEELASSLFSCWG